MSNTPRNFAAALSTASGPTKYPSTRKTRAKKAVGTSPDAITAAEAALRFCVSLRTVRRMIAAKRLRVFHLGRAVRIPVSEIARLLAPPDLDFTKIG